MIQINSTEQMRKAIERARAGDLFVSFVRFRQFRVTNRETGAEYNVNFFVREGRRFGHCDCKGGERFACKHLAAALAVHVGIAAQRRGH
jgi:uncharacterized Zn finger protein